MEKNLLTAFAAASIVSCKKNQKDVVKPQPDVQANGSSTYAWESYSMGGYSFTNDA